MWDKEEPATIAVEVDSNNVVITIPMAMLSGSINFTVTSDGIK
jgi:hypothetical protein